ncbi:MAG: hypothetical protein ACRDRS_19295 [Pseudonocardiaceae bacterium]
MIKANPDQAQLPVPVRARALREGKLVYMAVPKLADPLPFFRLDPAKLDGEPDRRPRWTRRAELDVLSLIRVKTLFSRIQSVTSIDHRSGLLLAWGHSSPLRVSQPHDEITKDNRNQP